MKLGILNALPASYIFAGELADAEKFERLFASLEASFESVIYDATAGHLPASPADCEAYLITGSPCGVYDNEPWITGLEQFIRQAYAQEKKLVGICFGHQLIAQALGGQVKKWEQGWILGLREFHIQDQPKWLTPARAQCQLYFVNQDQVVKLPAGASVIGGSDFCPYTIYAIENRVLGIQAHIEQSERFMQLVIQYLKPRISTALGVEANYSLTQGLSEGERVAGWVVNFLEDGIKV